MPAAPKTSSSPATVIFWIGCCEQHSTRYSVGGTALCQGPCCDLSLLCLSVLEPSTAHLWDVLESLDGGSPLNLFKRLFTLLLKIELCHFATFLSSLQPLPGLLPPAPPRSSPSQIDRVFFSFIIVTRCVWCMCMAEQLCKYNILHLILLFLSVYGFLGGSLCTG